MTFDSYQLSKLIPPLYPKYRDEEIAIHFKISIAEVRQFLVGPVPLTNAAWQEILAFHSDASDNAIKMLYNTSMHQIKKWSSGKGRDKIKLSQNEVYEIVNNCTSLKEASKLTDIPVCKLKALIPKTEKIKSMPSKEKLLAMEGTHAEIAEQLGVSRSYVTRVISDKHKPSTPNKIKDWAEVEKYLEANSLLATAKHFGVSPSAICHWRKRNANKTS